MIRLRSTQIESVQTASSAPSSSVILLLPRSPPAGSSRGTPSALPPFLAHPDGHHLMVLGSTPCRCCPGRCDGDRFSQPLFSVLWRP